MKIIKAGFSKTFPLQQYYEKIWLEAELNDGEDERQALYDLKKKVDNFFYESNKAAEKELAQIAQQVSDVSPKSQVERIIQDIGTCKEVKTLESYKLIAKNNPEIQKAYDNQLKIISND